VADPPRPAPDPLSDVHMIGQVVENRLRLLGSDESLPGEGLLSREARDAILEFARSKKGEVSDLRFRTYLVRLPQVAARLGEEFLRPTKNTPSRFKEAFPEKRHPGDSKGYEQSSRESSWYVARAFWGWWFERKDEDIPRFLRIKFPKNGHEKIRADSLLSRDDVLRMASQALNQRDKAWIWCLYQSRLRPGELFGLRLRDVVLHDGYIELLPHREKGSVDRPAPVYEDAVPALLAWLDSHPRKGDREAPLWVGIHGRGQGRAVSFRSMYNITIHAARRAKLDKPAYPYAFRHAGITELAKDPRISTAVLAAAAGWVPGSRRAQTYVHLANKDVTAALNLKYGIEPTAEDNALPAAHPPRQCGRCHTMNRPSASFCTTCGGPLDLTALNEREAEEQKEHRIYTAMLPRGTDRAELREATAFLEKTVSEILRREGIVVRQSSEAEQDSNRIKRERAAQRRTGPRSPPDRTTSAPNRARKQPTRSRRAPASPSE
jgi:integrase